MGLAAAVLIAVSGCSDVGTADDRDPADPVSTTQGTPQTPPPSTPVTPPSTSETPSQSNEALVQAGETALTEVDGTVTSIDDEDRGTRWEVEVTTANGTQNDIETSADGKAVLRGPTPEQDDAEDKAKHRQRVADAKIDFRKAVEIISGAAPGRITELELDSHNGKTVWEADVVDNSQTKREVRIDAGTGTVL